MSKHDQAYIEKFQSEDTSYNGWKNHATWNVALWIGGDQGLYEFAKECGDYDTFRDSLRDVGQIETADRVAYNDSALDIKSLNEYISEL
jgi:hypothetical protein